MKARYQGTGSLAGKKDLIATFFLPSSPMYSTMPLLGIPVYSSSSLDSEATLPTHPHPSTCPQTVTLQACKMQGTSCFPASGPSLICCTLWAGGKGWSRAGLPDGDRRMSFCCCHPPKKAVTAALLLGRASPGAVAAAPLFGPCFSRSIQRT